MIIDIEFGKKPFLSVTLSTDADSATRKDVLQFINKINVIEIK